MLGKRILQLAEQQQNYSLLVTSGLCCSLAEGNMHWTSSWLLLSSPPHRTSAQDLMQRKFKGG